MEKFHGVCLFLSIVGIIGLTRALPASTKQVKQTLFARNLDSNELPVGLNGTGLHVNVTIVVKNFLALDPKTNTLKLQMLVRMRWNDRRLIYTPFPPDTAPDNVSLDASSLEKIWVPKIYYVDEIHKEMDKQNQLIRLFVKTGDIEYSSLVTLKTRCPIRLRHFPHDRQTCMVKISSYGYTKSDLVFDWNPQGASVLAEAMPDYSLESFETNRCDSETTTGSYSCIQLELNLKRGWRFYLLQVYIPCTMLIITSWLSYFLHPVKSATPRLIVTISALGLAAVGMSGFNLALSPLTNYTKAIDIWNGLTMTFIFSSVVEFVIVNYLNQYPCSHSTSNRCNNKKLPPSSEAGDGENNAEQQTPLNPDAADGGGENEQPCQQDSGGGKDCGAKLDIIFRIVIPILFCVFVTLYTLAIIIFA